MKKSVRSGSKKGADVDARSQRRTAAQRRARQHLGQFSGMWSQLTEEQRTAWRQRASETGRLVRNGQYYRLGGQQLFNKTAGDIMVFASPPYSAGRAYCRDYRFLGLLPAPVEHVSDITRLYIRKYGVPPANTRIFIRAWQQVDGWECRG